MPKAPPGLPELPASNPMHILLEPEVIVKPAACPKPTLDTPPTTFANASYPTAVFLPPVVQSVKALYGREKISILSCALPAVFYYSCC